MVLRWWENSRINYFYQLNFGPPPPRLLQLHVDLSVSFGNGFYRWILCIEGSIYSFGYSLRGPRRTTESLMTKFGFIRCGKGEIFWRKTERNETTAQLSDLERQRLQVSRLFALTSQWTPKGDWKHFMPSSFFAHCFQVWFVFIKTEHFQSFKKRP